MNCFTLNPESESIYNNPLIDANDKYLVDDNAIPDNCQLIILSKFKDLISYFIDRTNFKL